MVLTLQDIRYSYPNATETALEGASATFPPGWCGVIGDNGCGKSTLARIACGLIIPDSGDVFPRLCSSYCPQDATTPPDMLEGFACDFSRQAIALREHLGIDDDMAWRFGFLSFGERKKLQVATALWQRPELLVLDEPTNHVDARCREALTRALRGYRGIGLLISHDRMLLNALTENCLICSDGIWTMRPGNLDRAQGEQARERTEVQSAKAKAEGEARRLAIEADARARSAAKTASRRSARHLDQHDGDGRAKRRLAVVTGQDGKTGALAGRMDARAAAARDRADALHAPKRRDGSLHLPAEPCARKTLLLMDEHDIPCGDAHLHLPKLVIGNRDRIGISGPNGAGKSTLLNHLIEQLPPDAAIFTIPQEIPPRDADRMLQRLREAGDEHRGRLLALAARLNSDAKRILSGDGVSPGELRKLMLAEAALAAPAIIAVDEPTNHLDLHSTEALEQAFATYRGALIVISHDEPFLEACTDIRWIAEDGALRLR